jgi:hypothetical protein
MMTDSTMAPRAMLEKSSDAELLRAMVGFTTQRLMELEAESLTGVPYGKPSEEHVNQCNGFPLQRQQRARLAMRAPDL